MKLTGTTYGELLGPAMKVQTREEATEYFEALVDRCMEINRCAGIDMTRQEVEGIQRDNIGYWTGYCGSEAMIRVQGLFDCAHPIFGKCRSKDDLPTAKEAMDAGADAARAANAKWGLVR